MEDRTKEQNGSQEDKPTAEGTPDFAGEQAGAQENPEEAVKRPKISEGLKKALIRCGIALVIVIVLLASTRFSIAEIIKGPTQTTDIQSEKEGAFVRRDIYAIVGYSDSDKSGQAVVGEYALVPMDGKFVTVHLPRRYLSSADTVLEETKNYLSGESSTLDKYFVVDGTVSKLSDAQKKKLSDWYAANKDWMVEQRVIDQTEDSSDYLSDTILEVDRINGMSQIAVIILSGIAAVFLLYIIVELVLMACGYYLNERIKARLARADKALADGQTVEEIAAAVRQEGAEAPEKGEAEDEAAETETAAPTQEEPSAAETGDAAADDTAAPEGEADVETQQKPADEAENAEHDASGAQPEEKE